MDFVASTLGGVIIGSSAGSLWYLHGRICGISGIVAGLLKNPSRSELLWRGSFVSGLVVGGLVLQSVYPKAFGSTSSTSGSDAQQLLLMALSGGLVGLGTQLGNGCTSGHGVCGLARFSPRSLAATLTFMSFGILTTFLARQFVAPSHSFSSLLASLGLAPLHNASLSSLAAPLTWTAAAFAALFASTQLRRSLPTALLVGLTSFLPGLTFALGLGISGMTNSEKVIGFLDVTSRRWDPSLMFVMAGALCVNTIIFHSTRNRAQPKLADCEQCKWNLPATSTITKSLIGGAALFGIGWGLSGICPGPAIVQGTQLISSPAKALGIGTFIASMLLGFVAQSRFFP